MLKKMVLISAMFCYGFSDIVELTPTQSGIFTHTYLCCGYNVYYDSNTSPLWIGNCNSNPFGCASSSLAGTWRWDLSEFENAEIISASVDFSASYCLDGAVYSFNPIM